LGDVVRGGGIISEMYLFYNWLRGTKLSYLLLVLNYVEGSSPRGRPWYERRDAVREDTLLQTWVYPKSTTPSSPLLKGPLASISDVVSPSSIVDAGPVGPASWDSVTEVYVPVSGNRFVMPWTGPGRLTAGEIG